ncbi:MAG: sugar phosphate isomerase/epimerase [Butyrivibrio sp.]|nr:sugar phosphate isomerase/epimerase [Butyrivibrio sp.]
MEIEISNYAFGEFHTHEMKNLRKDLGIEVFLEYGNEYYWNSILPFLMEDRSGTLSVHGPFSCMDLSDIETDFELQKPSWIWTFELCQKHKVKHCVCHPYSGMRTDNENMTSRINAQKCSVERVLILAELARKYSVDLLVENLPDKKGLMNEEEFLSCFGPYKELSFVIDTGHANLQEWDMDHVFKVLGDRIKAFHINDNNKDKDSHLMAWEGTFDWDDFFENYMKFTPDATLVLEYHKKDIKEIEASSNRIKKMLL